MDREKAKRLHSVIATSRALADDKTASIAPELYGRMKYDGALIEAGTRINWNGVLKKTAVDLWDLEGNNPDNSPNLWADLLYKKGYRIIPSILTVTTAFSNGEKGWEGDILYSSRKDENVYPPSVRPEDWEVAE